MPPRALVHHRTPGRTLGYDTTIETGTHTDSYRLAGTGVRAEEPSKAGWPLPLPALKAG